MRYTFTPDEQEELRRCPHVRSVSARMVQFAPTFKRAALEAYERGISAERFFREMGVPALLLKKDYAADTLRCWRKIAKTHGMSRFGGENRGKCGVAALAKWRNKQKAYAAMSDKGKVAFLEAQVELLEHIADRFHLPLPLHKGAHDSRRRKNAG